MRIEPRQVRPDALHAALPEADLRRQPVLSGPRLQFFAGQPQLHQ
jgi:hypothetical protein